MIKIYFCGCGYSDYVLCKRGPASSSSGYHMFTDILGRKYSIPVASCVLWYEPWDGNRSSFSNRYTKALDELQGKETGIANTSTK